MDANSENKSENKELNKELKCTNCGAILAFKPGGQTLKCNYCDAENVIEVSDIKIEEIDYNDFIATKLSKEEKMDIVSVRCNACGANTTLQPNVTSDSCPYCAANLVVQSGSTSTILKPRGVMPFDVDKNRASESFRNWINSRWFAPSDLKHKASAGNLDGLYVPYWTYDSKTQTGYTGQRGTYYYVNESYTTTENGRTVTRTRQVRKTHWTLAAGNVNNLFDDILIIASKSLPTHYAQALEPWDLKKMMPYNDKYLSGFRTETYQLQVTDGLELAKGRMYPIIQDTIRRDIGGDEQRILTMNTTYSDITFKHVLLPVWISAYRYGEKVYRFLINGQTGEVQGERPYSVIKIILAILSVLIVIGVFIMISNS